MRLLISNKHFHENKEGTEEFNAQDYIELTVNKLNLELEDTDYADLKRRIYNRHTQGIDLATLILRNNKYQRIAQWQSHKQLKSFDKNKKCILCEKNIRNIQHYIECYQGEKPYKDAMSRINISINVIRQGSIKSEDYLKTINSYKHLI